MTRLLLLLVLVGCVAPPAASVSTAELEFGLVPTGGLEVRSVELTNVGGEPLSLSLEVVGDAPEAWSVSPRSVELAPGTSVLASVTFGPTALGVRTGVLRAGEQAVAVRGEGGPSQADRDGDGWSPWTGDCDDGRADVHPGAEELCDGVDADCDGLGDEVDEDEDGYLRCVGCADGACGDCDDTAEDVHPGRTEACDGVDTDCDGLVGDGFDQDGDGDTPCEGDCDDTNAAVSAVELEVCGDGLDNDCSGEEDDLDEDRDGWSPCGRGDCDSDSRRQPLVVDASAAPGGDGSEDAPFATVAAALEELPRICPHLYLRPGEYSMEVASESVLIRGADRDTTVVRPTSAAAPLIRFSRLFHAAGELALESLTVRGSGEHRTASAIDLWSESTALEFTIRDVVFEGFRGADPFIYVRGEDVPPWVHISDSVFQDNAGLVLEVEDAILRVEDSRFERNGAPTLEGVQSRVELLRSTFVENVGTAYRGAVWIWRHSDLTVANSVFHSNRPSAVSVRDGSVDIVNNTFAGNGLEASGEFAVSVDFALGVIRSNIVVGPSGGIHRHPSFTGVDYNTVHVAGDPFGPGVNADAWAAADNHISRPGLVAWSDDGDPSNDDLGLAPGAAERDSGPSDPHLLDRDGSRNDRGHTGGPGAAP